MMAERRMFTKTIIDSDAFLDMSLSAQALYFHLSMRADDDGFINNPKKIQRVIGGSEDDLKLLLTKRFILVFNSGVIVIKHWKMHNYIRKDRYNPTVYQDEKNQLKEKENGSYTDVITGGQPDDNHLSTSGQPDDNRLDTQVRLGKDRLGKDSKDDKQSSPEQTKKEPVKHKYGEYKNVLLSDEQLEKLKSEFPNDWEERIERVSEYCASSGKTYKNYLATIRNWAKKEKPQPNKKQANNSMSETQRKIRELEGNI